MRREQGTFVAAIGETTVSLRIYGDALDHDEISRLLGCPPSSVIVKGHVRPRGYVELSNMWMLTRDCHAPGDLQAKIRDLLDSVSNEPSVWVDLKTRFGLDMFAGLFMTGWDEGFDLDPATLAELGNKGVKLGICIYGPSGDEGA